MEEKKNYLTAEGLERINAELDDLKSTKRKEIAQRISDAKELGDLSENAEYHEAKDEQGFVETRILELEQTLRNAELIKHTKNSSTIQIGSTVTITSKESGTLTITIVGSSEASPAEKKISNESPLGEALLGKSVGDSVIVKTPGGEMKYTVEKAA
jgi:transcription elongation factor GreA